MMHETYPKDIASKSKNKDNGDLTDRKTIKLFGGKFVDQKANFITADGGFDWANENSGTSAEIPSDSSRIATILLKAWPDSIADL